MSREDKIQIVNWCQECKITTLTINKEEYCANCQGLIKEIGWVETNG